MDIVISFDDTGSMSSVRKEVRRKLNKLVEDLYKTNSNLNIGIIIHNDYCDHDTIQQLDLTNDKPLITSFINRSSSCGGGDSDECYELVLQTFNNIEWKSDKKVCILIGDANPHEVGYRYKDHVNNISWKNESMKCANNGIKVYTVQALGSRFSVNFYNEVARLTNGLKLDLTQFDHITEYILAIINNENGSLEEYEKHDDRFKYNLAFKNMFNVLKGNSSIVSLEKLNDLSKFQVLNVTENCVIKDFVELTGAKYKAGKGFYQLTKSELIQENKEVLMVFKLTGETISDTIKCRQLLGIPFGTRGNINPRTTEICSKYDVYIQSTSYNRKLVGGTKFLYELDHT